MAREQCNMAWIGFTTALRAMEDANWLITVPKSRLLTWQLTSHCDIIYDDQRERQVSKAINVIVRCCLRSWHGSTSSQIFRAHRDWNSEMRFFLGYRWLLFVVGWLVTGWIVAELLNGSRCHLAKILEDCKFSLEILGPKVVLLCTFSLYQAVPEASASPASWMIRPEY